MREREMANVGVTGADTPYGSDDEEYDDIFMNVIREEERTSNQQEQLLSQMGQGMDADQDMIDMS